MEMGTLPLSIASFRKCPYIITSMPLALPSPRHFRPLSCPTTRSFTLQTILRPDHPCNAQPSEKWDPQPLVDDLRVPDHWLHPSRARQESEWLRVTLHKWLDDEYCPEPTNVEISKIAAHSYYESLMVKQVDLGEILLKMVRDLESISYQESFHGAFSSANAAAHLIALRIEAEEEK
ncbi:uncharacterized protein LOC131230366 [Magnolia sinica]|uniref:uncharacterized protein LOC131230366 n=1 Tax=Magnolia sinica TaxID=86752 RepID=UPI00265960F4|nr:uncharacterized protein LOC131230366 [Magnolia sinica]